MSVLRLLPCLFIAVLLTLLAPALQAQSHYDREADSTTRLYFDAVKARMLGDNQLSEILLKDVIKRAPEHAAPYYDLSRLALKSNDITAASNNIKKAIGLDSNNKWYQEQYANTLVLQNDILDAANVYARLAQKEHLNDDYLERSAALYQRAGKYQEAIAQLERLRQKGDEENVLLMEQAVYLKMNDVEGAAGVIRELIRMHPREPRYYTMLAEVYDNNKLPKKAAEVIEEMSRKFPNDPSLQINLAAQALKKGDTLTYRSYVRKAVINKELSADMQLYLLRNYISELPNDSQRQQEARSLTQEVLAQHPNNSGLLSFYAYMLSLNGENAAAAEQVKKALALKKDDFTLWQQLLYNYTDPQYADSLIQWSLKAARLFPNQAQVHYLNGLGHYNKKEYPMAIRSIQRAIDLEPEDKKEELSEMHTVLGDIYNSIKEYTLSDSNYNQALRLNPNNATVLNNYAYYLSVRNTRLNDAERMSKKSLDLRPHEATFLDTYAWILYRQGKYQDALHYMNQVFEANPNASSSELWEHLGAIQFKLGNIAQAVEAWKKAKALGSDNPALDKMIAEQKLYE
ncbi:MAG: tetratricopeptide repeat protein [Bacteroidetes bacterium]|nr:tetratricopeptide repeat protein [Bacteroidota bacterium]